MKKNRNKSSKVREAVRAESGRRLESAGSFIGQLKHDRSVWFLIYFAIVIAHLLLNQGGSIDLERHPIWAFRTFAFGGLIIFSILDRQRIKKALQSINLLGFLPIALIILIITSNIVSIRPFETVEESMNILSYAALAFLCYTYVSSISRLRQFLEIILVAGFLIAFHGLFIFYGALWGDGETRPLSSLFYWHNPCAGFLLLIWPSMLAQYYAIRRGWQTFLIMYIFFITFTAFGLTLSRGGWLAGMIPFFLIPALLSRKKLMISWRPILLVVLYFASAIPFILKYRGRFFQPIIDRFNQIRLDDYSVVGRFEFWEIAWKVFLKHPIFGIGFNTFGYYYVDYQTNPQYYTKDPHNVYLRFLLEGGIAGGIVILSILALLIRLFIRTIRIGPGKMLTVYRVGLLAGIAGELFHMAIDFDWTFPVIPMLIVCQLAIVSRSFTYPEAEQELTIDQWEPESKNYENDTGSEEGTENPVVNRQINIKPLSVWRALAAILFLTNLFGYISMNYYEQGKYVILNQEMLAESRVQEEMSQAQRELFRSQTQEIQSPMEMFSQARKDLIGQGIGLWKKSLIYNPWNWYSLKDLLAYNYIRAEEAYDTGDAELAEELLRECLNYGDRLLSVTPYRPATHYDLGKARILAGKIRDDENLEQQGLASMLHAIDLDPVNIPKYYFGVAEFYFEKDNLDDAMRYIETLEEIFVPRYADGSIDFGALRGKSLARQDWVDITETCRDAWWLKAEILVQQNKLDDAILTLYSGLNTPVGGGEYRESYYDLGMLQLRFMMRIADLSAMKDDWVTVELRSNDAIKVMRDREILDSPEGRMMQNLYYTALAHNDENAVPGDVAGESEGSL